MPGLTRLYRPAFDRIRLDAGRLLYFESFTRMPASFRCRLASGARVFWAVAAIAFLQASVAAQADEAEAEQAVAEKPFTQTGLASYYSGRGKTASADSYDADGFTAAHRTLPFGSRVRVEHLKNGKSVEVVIDDRGPFRKKRMIDISRKAAKALGMIRQGIARVRITLIKPADND